MGALDPETRRKLREMRVPELADAIEEVWADPGFANVAPMERLSAAVDRAWDVMRSANVERLITRAHLRERQADIGRVVYEGRPLDRDKVLELGTCGFMEYHRDVILEGFTGTGKTWLACALARQACRHGYNAMYVRMPDLFFAREEWLSSGRSESKFLRRYSNFGMLVLDEWLIDPLTPEQARFVFELVERRYDRGSNVFCTQYPFAEWHQRLGGGAHADAIMDRIAHNSISIDMGTRNMREVTSTVASGKA